MNIDTEFTHVTLAGGNVFADLRFEPKEAATLQAESPRIIREKLMFKNSLISECSTDEKPI